MISSVESPPRADEFEVSVFGPGIGECVVLHIGENRWLIADSCLEDGDPVALRYLKQIGVDPEQIEHVVVTHWHSDHIRGIAKIYERAPNADLHCSSALNATEFKRLVKAGRAPLVDLGTHEIEQALVPRFGSPIRVS